MIHVDLKVGYNFHKGKETMVLVISFDCNTYQEALTAFRFAKAHYSNPVMIKPGFDSNSHVVTCTAYKNTDIQKEKAFKFAYKNQNRRLPKIMHVEEYLYDDRIGVLSAAFSAIAHVEQVKVRYRTDSIIALEIHFRRNQSKAMPLSDIASRIVYEWETVFSYKPLVDYDEKNYGNHRILINIRDLDAITKTTADRIIRSIEELPEQIDKNTVLQIVQKKLSLGE